MKLMKKLTHLSEYLYGIVLQFYPKRYRQEFGKEMQYVYSETLKDAVDDKGTPGIINFWFITALDALKSLIKEHIENVKGGVAMKKSNDIVMNDKVFLWIGAGTVLLLLIPAFLMYFQVALLDPGSGYEVINWGMEDFIAMGILLFGAGSSFIFLARRIKKNRLLIALGVLIALILVWAELAVGIFGTPFAGS